MRQKCNENGLFCNPYRLVVRRVLLPPVILLGLFLLLALLLPSLSRRVLGLPLVLGGLLGPAVALRVLARRHVRALPAAVDRALHGADPGVVLGGGTLPGVGVRTLGRVVGELGVVGVTSGGAEVALEVTERGTADAPVEVVHALAL